jgi:uncharacterized membrane protein
MSVILSIRGLMDSIRTMEGIMKLTQRGIKTISWSVLDTSITFLIFYIATGSIVTAVVIELIDRLVKIGVYWLHELYWEKKKK